MRKTKIVATIGPKTSSKEMLKLLIKAGVNIFRFNFSHGDHQFHRDILHSIREISAELNTPVATIQDLCGPKIRLTDLDHPFNVHNGDKISFSRSCNPSNTNLLSINHPEIFKNIHIGNLIYIADGTIQLKVLSVSENQVETTVLIGGVISSRKGVSFPDVNLNIPAITEKDIKDIEFGVKNNFDWIAVSFVKEKQDVENTRALIKKFGGNNLIISKIEKHEALANLDDIINVSDAIMVARGDLGVDVPIEKVPIIQKEIIKKSNISAKPVITATQMLLSMVKNDKPTRAEVSDIANAVLDGTDAVMLSDETTIGEYPVEAVTIMDKIITETEKHYPYFKTFPQTYSSAVVAFGAVTIAKELKAEVIAVFTQTGFTANQVARYRPSAPIVAIVNSREVYNNLILTWGVKPFILTEKGENTENIITKFIKKALKDNIINSSSCIVITIGSPFGNPGSTNAVRVIDKETIKKYL